MYFFLPRSNKYYAWMLNTNSFYRYSILVSCMASIIFLWSFLVYIPLSHAVTYYSHQLTIINTQKVACERIKVNYKKTTKAITHVQALYNRLVKSHIGEENIDVSVPFACASKTGVILHNYAHTREKDIEWAKKYNTSLSLSASFEQLIHFVVLMHNTPGTYMTHTFTVNSEQENSFLLHSNFKNIFMKKA